MKLGRESTNFEDKTVPRGLDLIKTQIGQYLYKHGYVNGANKLPYNPNVQPYNPDNYVPVDKNGRRSDLDWDSNKNIPGMSLMAPSHAANDQMAKKMGFKNADVATAYYRKQQEMRRGPVDGASASSGSLLDQIFALHPAVLLKGVLQKMDQAGVGKE